jgi:hypothetical protein
MPAPRLDALHRELGLEYALASQRLFNDGAEILYDYAQRAQRREKRLVKIKSRGQESRL